MRESIWAVKLPHIGCRPMRPGPRMIQFTSCGSMTPWILGITRVQQDAWILHCSLFLKRCISSGNALVQPLESHTKIWFPFDYLAVDQCKMMASSNHLHRLGRLEYWCDLTAWSRMVSILSRPKHAQLCSQCSELPDSSIFESHKKYCTRIKEARQGPEEHNLWQSMP